MKFYNIRFSNNKSCKLLVIDLIGQFQNVFAVNDGHDKHDVINLFTYVTLSVFITVTYRVLTGKYGRAAILDMHGADYSVTIKRSQFETV